MKSLVFPSLIWLVYNIRYDAEGAEPRRFDCGAAVFITLNMYLTFLFVGNSYWRENVELSVVV